MPPFPSQFHAHHYLPSLPFNVRPTSISFSDTDHRPSPISNILMVTDFCGLQRPIGPISVAPHVFKEFDAKFGSVQQFIHFSIYYTWVCWPLSSCSLSIWYRSRALRALVGPVTSHLFLPSSSLFVFTSFARSSEAPHCSICWFLTYTWPC